MGIALEPSKGTPSHMVTDIGLAEFGRKEIEIAEH